MKRAFEESLERDYRQAGLTADTIQRITEWIQKAEKNKISPYRGKLKPNKRGHPKT